jgi:flagellar FliL protein
MDDETEAAPRKKSKLGAIIGYVVVLVAGIGGGYGASLFLGGGAATAGDPPAKDEHGMPLPEEAEAAPAPAGAHGATAAAEGGEAAPAAGSAITNLGSFTLNLRGSGGGRILRMEVQVETDAALAPKVGERTPQLRDSILGAVSDYTWGDLEGTDGKVRLREELLARANGVMSPSRVDQVYLTQFVVQ